MQNIAQKTQTEVLYQHRGWETKEEMGVRVSKGGIYMYTYETIMLNLTEDKIL